MTRSWSDPRAARVVLAAAIVALGAAFLLHAAHFAFITDDAYISFRYARNLVDGHGLVYNPGERVEGYTNFLWVLGIAGLLALDLDPETWVTVVSRGLSLALLAYLLWLGRLRHGRVDGLGLVAVALLASNRTFAAWSTGGLATAAFTTASFVAMAEYGRSERPTLRHGILFAIAALVRPEGVLFFAVASLDSVARAAREPRRWLHALGWTLGFFALFVPYFAWRVSYYGYLLPNTFYAKVPDPAGYLSMGTRYLAGFVAAYQILPLSLPAVGTFWTAASERRLTGLLLGAALAYVGYVVWVGGDFMEFRFMMPALPAFYFCVQEGLRGARDLLARRFGPTRANVAVAIVFGLALAATARPTFRYTHPEGIGWTVEGLRTSTWIEDLTGRWLRTYGVPGESLATYAGGVGPYRSGLHAVEMRGLTDASVAHAPIAGRNIVGHEREVPRESLAEKRITYAITLGPRTFTTEPLDDPAVVSVQREPGVWLNFETFEPIDALRRRLLDRGALVVLPGPCTSLFDPEHGAAPIAETSPEGMGTRALPAFRLRGRQLRLRVSGGHDPERLTVALHVDGRRVRWATGPGSEAVRTELWHVASFEGHRARLVLRDEATGPGGFLRLHGVALCAPSP